MGLNLTINDDRYYTEDFKVMIRSNRDWLLSNSMLIPITNPSIVNAHKYDFYTVLRIIGISSVMHWVLAYLNDIGDPAKDISGMTSYLSIDLTVINQMIARQNTVRK